MTGTCHIGPHRGMHDCIHLCKGGGFEETQVGMHTYMAVTYKVVVAVFCVLHMYAKMLVQCTILA